jgi:hypothetical protein
VVFIPISFKLQFLHILSSLLDREITVFENFTRPFASLKHSLKKKIKKVINDSYSKKTLEKLSSFNETSKLYIYGKIKSELKLENYLICI